MEYNYVAYTAERKVVKGLIDATSQMMAEQALRNTGYEPLSLSAKAKAFDLAKILPSLFAVKPADIIDFSRQLALLLECGVTISSALQLLQENVSNKPLRKVIAVVNSDLRSGGSFSGALAKHPKVFGELFCRIVAVGERTGTLETSLREICSYLEKQQVSAKKTTRALTYPIIVLLLAIGVAVLMTTVVLPQMTIMFTAMRVELPLPTRILLGISAFVTDYKVHILAGILLAAICIIGLAVRPSGRRFIQTIMLRAPLIGRVTSLMELSRFARTVSMLLHAGLNLPEIIDLAMRGTKNSVVRDSLRGVKTFLLQGRALAIAMTGSTLFPNAFIQMVAVGEETGKLETTLATVAQAYEQEADDRTTVLIGFIEPAMTLFIALVVGFIALSVITPMYSIIGELS
jgi:type IV pilus assembly protein PilC